MACIIRTFHLYISKNASLQGLSKNYWAEAAVVSCCRLHTSSQRLGEAEGGEQQQEQQEQDITSQGPPEGMEKGQKVPVIDVDTSIRYMQSNAFKITYQGELVWTPYRRNHKGSMPPKKTRKMCIRAGLMATGNPCPLCRDEYLVVHHRNVELLKQFISPISGEIIDNNKTGVCRTKQKSLKIEITKAIDQGLIKMKIPRRQYNYAEYYPHLRQEGTKSGDTQTDSPDLKTDTTEQTPTVGKEVAL